MTDDEMFKEWEDMLGAWRNGEEEITSEEDRVCSRVLSAEEIDSLLGLDEKYLRYTPEEIESRHRKALRKVRARSKGQTPNWR